MKIDEIDKTLLVILENGNYYSLEELSSKLGVDKADIHRSFIRLCKLQGWSIRPYNRLPYWRGFGVFHNRGRNKGEKYDHDNAEPDWLRTLYEVKRPEQ